MDPDPSDVAPQPMVVATVPGAYTPVLDGATTETAGVLVARSRRITATSKSLSMPL